MFRVRLDLVTMAGNQYVLYEGDGAGATFPHGELREGEQPADAARRVVKEWTGTDAPKLELVDLRVVAPGELALLVRAHLTGEPAGKALRVERMGLPARVGALAGADVEEALKTSLSYKLTRR
jgi:ADP-ribose pyrophosphatase YjhB (NUDIX family)